MSGCARLDLKPSPTARTGCAAASSPMWSGTAPSSPRRASSESSDSSPHPARVGVLLGHMHHGELELFVTAHANGLRFGDMRGAPELKQEVAARHSKLGPAGLVGASMK